MPNFRRIRAAYWDIMITDVGLETEYYDGGFMVLFVTAKVRGGTVLYLMPWLLFLHPYHLSIW
jgi:hypothetical protein